MIYIVKNNKVVDNSANIEEEIRQFMDAEELKKLKEIIFIKQLQEKSNKIRAKKLEK